MKHIYCIIAVCVLAAALAGCAQPTADRYSDFLQNEDILMRFEVCYADVKNGRAGLYTTQELRALKRDMQEGYGTGDAEADYATQLLEEAAELLARASEQEGAEAEAGVREARDCFDKAMRAAFRVTEGAYDG